MDILERILQAVFAVRLNLDDADAVEGQVRRLSLIGQQLGLVKVELLALERRQVVSVARLELMESTVDDLILAIERLSLLAEEFVLDPEGVKARIMSEEAVVERLRLGMERLQGEIEGGRERERRKPEWVKFCERVVLPGLRRYWLLFRSFPWWVQVLIVLLVVGMLRPR